MRLRFLTRMRVLWMLGRNHSPTQVASQGLPPSIPENLRGLPGLSPLLSCQPTPPCPAVLSQVFRPWLELRQLMEAGVSTVWNSLCECG